jgi:hypothetical protein
MKKDAGLQWLSGILPQPSEQEAFTLSSVKFPTYGHGPLALVEPYLTIPATTPVSPQHTTPSDMHTS